ncbi:hypothetical protein ACFVHS_44110 [Streptomyces sp. NPDC057746]|uniref:hypothetical protein n=1 Tax=Streptomyces sp. NPDC057746 TaxID=3346237 RepID=UPI0036996E70
MNRTATAQGAVHFREQLLSNLVDKASRPYASDCRHEHACIRCPVLRVNPQMAFRLEEIETDLIARRARIDAEGWLGEIEGIDLTLRLLRQKQVEAERLAYVPQTVDLGIPVVVPHGRQYEEVKRSSTLPGRGRKG